MTAVCEQHGVEKIRRRHGFRSGTIRFRLICRTCEAERQRKHRLKYQHAKRKWDRENTEKRLAHKAVAIALRKGELTALPCERCGSTPAHAHHDNYSRPLEVMWLCPKHHKERHRELQ